MTTSPLSVASSLSGFFVGDPKFHHVFAQDTLAVVVTNILLLCPLYVVQRPGGLLSALLLYDMVCFSTSKYMKSHYLYSSYYLNSPQNLKCRH